MSPLRRPEFRRFWISVLSLNLAAQMAAVAIGWQVYEISGEALDLGLVGLMEFLPLLLLALPAGQLADRFSRRRLYALSTSIFAGVLAALVGVTLADVTVTWPYFALALATRMSQTSARPRPPPMA